ncbi:MAG: Npt1/Npt2 family nucleotide transporter [Alphaproteobacteria bacterium]
MSTQTAEPEFGKIRGALWPIHNEEMKKFLPMGLIMFFILFIYTLLRDTKDALIVTAPGGGAAVIPFLKLGFTMPCSVLFVVLYAKLANVFSREKLFYLLVGSFLVYFGCFALFLYPNHESLHPSAETVAALKLAYPNFQHVFPVWGMWTYSIFYVCSELWGSVMISLLFWQFANEITRTHEAKRFYSLFGFLANVSLLVSGFTIRYFSDVRAHLPPEVDAWGYSLNYLMASVALAGVFIMVIYRWMNTNILTDPKYYDAAVDSGKPKKKKPKLSVGESFKYLLNSKYLGLIAILVLSYGVAINLVEIIWKDLLRQQYPNPNDYNTFMGGFSAATGATTMILIMLFKGVVRRFGWFTGAIFTPAMLLVTAGAFFAFMFLKEQLEPVAAMFGMTTLLMAVFIGAAQNIMSKGTKYSLFDPTKEMAYIPLDEELKVKGKAAVDVIGGRLGKATGGAIAGTMLIITAATNIMTIAPVLAVVIMAVIAIWMFAVVRLNRQYTDLVEEEETTEEPAIKKAA